MSLTSRARRAHKHLPWLKYLSVHEALRRLLPAEDDRYVEERRNAALTILTFEEKVRWFCYLAEAARDGQPLLVVEGPVVETSEERIALAGFVAGLDRVSLYRFVALYVIGATDADDPPTTYAGALKNHPDPTSAVELLVQRTSVADRLRAAIEALSKMGVDVDDPWHERIPIDSSPLHDFVDQPRFLRQRTPGELTLEEIRELADAPDRYILVAEADPVMGPYTRCVLVKRSAAVQWIGRGYRPLDELRYEDGDDTNFEDFGGSSW